MKDNKQNITKKQMIAWIGSDNETFDHVLDILHQVVNGKWKVETLRSDILKYEDEDEDFEEYVFVPANNVLVKPASLWSQINDTFVDEGIIHIDAYKTEDENEEGNVIAKIEVATGKVCYLDERARKDWYADEVIAENVRQILDEKNDDLNKTMDKIRDENF
jgi:hypothetical protein